MVQMRDIVDTSQDLELCNCASYLLSRELLASIVSITGLLGSDAALAVCVAICDCGFWFEILMVMLVLVSGEVEFENE